MRHAAKLLIAILLAVLLAPGAVSAQTFQWGRSERSSKAKPGSSSKRSGDVKRKKADSSASDRSDAGKAGEVKRKNWSIGGSFLQTREKAKEGSSEAETQRPKAKKRPKKESVKVDDQYPGRDKGRGKGEDASTGGRDKGKGDDVGRGKDEGKGDQSQSGDKDHDTRTPPEQEHPKQPDRRRPGVRIVIDPIRIGGREEDEKKKDEKKKDEEESEEPDEPEKKKDEKEEVDEPSEPATTNPPTSITGPFAATPPRELRFDTRTYRRLVDVLLAQNRVGAALRVLQLLKDREYLEYTGDFDELVASGAIPPETLPATPFASSGSWRSTVSAMMPSHEATRVAAKDKKKSSTDSESDEAERGEESWESAFEGRADAILSASAELEQLEAIPEGERKKKQQERIAQLRAELTGATGDVEALLDSLAGELGRKDSRLKRLRSSEDLMSELPRLGPGVVALYTIVAERRYWIVLVTPTSREAYSYAIDDAALNQKVLDFRAVLRNPKLDPLPLATELYRIVVGPVEKRLAAVGARTLMWSFDGVLRYVPVAALHDGRGYMVERYTNAMFTRGTLDRLKDKGAGAWNGLGLGVSKQVGSYQPLPAVAEELRGIFRESAGAAEDGVVAGDVVLDETFTGTALETALTAGHPVLHIATHFQLNPGDARASQLLLGDGTLVTVGDMRKVKGGFKGIDLLTLSACDTAASGTAPDGKEVECFGSVAQNRGARSVLASLWPVNDRSTSALMRSFYRLHEARTGLTKADALRQAQTMLVRGTLKLTGTGGADRILKHTEPADASGRPLFTPDPKAPFAHPYYWASFVLIGSWK